MTTVLKKKVEEFFFFFLCIYLYVFILSVRKVNFTLKNFVCKNYYAREDSTTT